MKPRVLVVQPSASDPPGRVGDWLREAGCGLTVVAGHLGDPLPSSLSGFHGLVVLGGEMGANDDAEFDWLPQAKDLLRQAVRADVATLGICLGHQLLAVAAGGQVAPGAHPQQGLFPVGLTVAGLGDPVAAALAGASAVHWNNDLVVSVPPGAVVLARAGHSVQAIRLGANVYGVQFHPEVDLATVAAWAGVDVASQLLSEQEAQARLDEIAEAEPQLHAASRALVAAFVGRLA